MSSKDVYKVNLREGDRLQISPIIKKNNVLTIFKDFFSSFENTIFMDSGILFENAKNKIDLNSSLLSTLCVDDKRFVRALDAYHFIQPCVGFNVWLNRALKKDGAINPWTDARIDKSNYDPNLHLMPLEEVKKRAYIKFYKLFMLRMGKDNITGVILDACFDIFQGLFGLDTNKISIRRSFRKEKTLNNTKKENVLKVMKKNEDDKLATNIFAMGKALEKLLENNATLANDVKSLQQKILELANKQTESITNVNNVVTNIMKLQNPSSVKNVVVNKIPNLNSPFEVDKVQQAYFTVEQFAIFLGFNDQIDLETKKMAGNAASRISEKKFVHKILAYGNEQFPVVNAYPFPIVKEAYESLGYNFV